MTVYLQSLRQTLKSRRDPGSFKPAFLAAWLLFMGLGIAAWPSAAAEELDATEVNLGPFVFSPDGRKLALSVFEDNHFSLTQPNRHRIELRNLSDGQRLLDYTLTEDDTWYLRVLAHFPINLAFSPDGRYLLANWYGDSGAGESPYGGSVGSLLFWKLNPIEKIQLGPDCSGPTPNAGFLGSNRTYFRSYASQEALRICDSNRGELMARLESIVKLDPDFRVDPVTAKQFLFASGRQYRESMGDIDFLPLSKHFLSLIDAWNLKEFARIEHGSEVIGDYQPDQVLISLNDPANDPGYYPSYGIYDYRERRLLKTFTSKFQSLKVLQDGYLCFFGLIENDKLVIEVKNPLTGRIKYPILSKFAPLDVFQLDNGDLLVIETKPHWSGTLVKRHDGRNGKLISEQSFDFRFGAIQRLLNGDLLMTGSKEISFAVLLDHQTGLAKLEHRFDFDFRQFAIRPDGKALAIVRPGDHERGRGPEVGIWNLANFSQVSSWHY